MLAAVLLDPAEADGVGGGELTLDVLGPVRDPGVDVVLFPFDGRAESAVPS